MVTHTLEFGRGQNRWVDFCPSPLPCPLVDTILKIPPDSETKSLEITLLIPCTLVDIKTGITLFQGTPIICTHFPGHSFYSSANFFQCTILHGACTISLFQELFLGLHPSSMVKIFWQCTLLSGFNYSLYCILYPGYNYS